MGVFQVVQMVPNGATHHIHGILGSWNVLHEWATITADWIHLNRKQKPYKTFKVLDLEC